MLQSLQNITLMRCACGRLGRRYDRPREHRLLKVRHPPIWCASFPASFCLHLSNTDLSPQLGYSVPAFATPNSSSTLTWDSGSQALLQRLVSSANSSGVGTKIVLSVGGASGAIISRLRLCDLEESAELFLFRLEWVVLVQVRRGVHQQTHPTYFSLLFHGH